MKIIYLAAGHGLLSHSNVVYQDLIVKRDLAGDMLQVDLSPFDVIIASPPCNYYSKANYRRDISNYSISTKYLLPGIISKCIKLGKPFIIENVINKKLMPFIYNFPGFYYEIGRHSYFTNIPFNCNLSFVSCEIENMSKKQRQGAGGVNQVFNYWLDIVLS